MIAIKYPTSLSKTNIAKRTKPTHATQYPTPFKTVGQLLKALSTHTAFIGSTVATQLKQDLTPKTMFAKGTRVNTHYHMEQSDLRSDFSHIAILDHDRKDTAYPTAVSKEAVMSYYSKRYNIAIYAESNTTHPAFKGRVFLPSSTDFNKKALEPLIQQELHQHFNSLMNYPLYVNNLKSYYEQANRDIDQIAQWSTLPKARTLRHEYLDRVAFEQNRIMYTYGHDLELWVDGKYIDTFYHNQPINLHTDYPITVDIDSLITTTPTRPIPTDLTAYNPSQVVEGLNIVALRAKEEGKTLHQKLKELTSGTYDPSTLVYTRPNQSILLTDLVTQCHDSQQSISCGYGLSTSNPYGHIQIKPTGSTVDYDSGDNKLLTLINSPTLYKPATELHVLTGGFESIWTGWGNHSSEPLKHQWSQIFNTLDAVVELNKDGVYNKSKVITDSTGGGKSQCMNYYLANTDTKALIVTKENEEAEDLAQTIEQWSCKGKVAVFNGDKEDRLSGTPRASTLEEAEGYPVIVISHSRYEKAVKTDINYFRLTKDRDLVCIDEELTIMTDVFINEYDIERLLTILKVIAHDHKAIKPLTDIRATMTASTKLVWAEAPAQTELVECDVKGFEGLLMKKILGTGSLLPITALLAENESDLEHILTGHYDATKSENIRKDMIALIEDYERIYDSYLFTTGNGVQAVLTSGRLHIPQKSQVVFDATAFVNPFYALQSDHAELIPRIPYTRTYANATAHILSTATGRNTWLGGLHSNESVIITSIDVMMSEVLAKYNGEPTLVVTYKDLEEGLSEKLESHGLLNTADNPDAPIYVAHWGAITGKNRWRHCSKLFIFGLNRKNKPYYLNREVAMTGIYTVFPQEGVVIEEKEEILDAMTAIERDITLADVMSDAVQAMNRGKSRSTIDEKGNCDKCDIYITLDSQFGWTEHGIKLIEMQMPDINIEDWKTEPETSQLRGQKESSIATRIIKKLKSLALSKGDGIATKSVLRSLGFNPKSKADQSAFNKALKGELFIDLLSEGGYELEGKKIKLFRRIK